MPYERVRIESIDDTPWSKGRSLNFRIDKIHVSVAHNEREGPGSFDSASRGVAIFQIRELACLCVCTDMPHVKNLVFQFHEHSAEHVVELTYLPGFAVSVIGHSDCTGSCKYLRELVGWRRYNLELELRMPKDRRFATRNCIEPGEGR